MTHARNICQRRTDGFEEPGESEDGVQRILETKRPEPPRNIKAEEEPAEGEKEDTRTVAVVILGVFCLVEVIQIADSLVQYFSR
jgi:hypothetical protein